MLVGLLGAMVAASAPSAQARTADTAPIRCDTTTGTTDYRLATNVAAATAAGCGTLQVCVSDLANNQGSGQFEIEGGGPTGGGYVLSKLLNAFGNLAGGNPDPSSAANVTLASIPATDDVTRTSLPCIGSVNSSNLQVDDLGVSLPAGTYTIYSGKYNSANCLKSVNGHIVEQPGGALVYANPVQRCHGKVHHFHVVHDDGTGQSSTNNNAPGSAAVAAGPSNMPPAQPATPKGIGMSAIEQPYMTVYVAKGQTTRVLAHMTDDRYPECQTTTSATSPNRVCEATPGPSGPPTGP